MTDTNDEYKLNNDPIGRRCQTKIDPAFVRFGFSCQTDQSGRRPIEKVLSKKEEKARKVFASSPTTVVGVHERNAENTSVRFDEEDDSFFTRKIDREINTNDDDDDDVDDRSDGHLSHLKSIFYKQTMERRPLVSVFKNFSNVGACATIVAVVGGQLALCSITLFARRTSKTKREHTRTHIG